MKIFIPKINRAFAAKTTKLFTLCIASFIAMTICAQEPIPATCAEAVAAMPAQSGSETQEVYVVTGYVTYTNGAVSPSRTDASIDQQTFYMDDVKGSKKTLQGYWCNLPGHEALNVGDKITLTGKILNYNNTPEIKNGNVAILEREIVIIDTIDATVCEVLEEGSSLNAGDYSDDVFRVYGRLKGQDQVNNNGQHTFEMACGEDVFKPYNCTGAEVLELGKGDSVVVIGKLYNYNGTIEISNGKVELIEKSGHEEVIIEVNVADAVAAAMALEKGATSDDRYAITGYVASIAIEYSESYGNISFFMTDDMANPTYDFEAYRVKVSKEDAAKIVVGVKVTVTATLQHYYKAATETQDEIDLAETVAGGTISIEDNIHITLISNNTEWGTTSGDVYASYLDQVQITAIANYGYHFLSWDDGITSNPRTIIVTGSATYQAIFAKNSYSITKSAKEEQGSISGLSQAEYLDEVTLTANPKYGYHFTQWSDSATDNPRLFIITQDTTFTAEFALDRTGSCGDDLALTWTYEPEEKVLTISGEGAFEQNMECGIEARTALQKIVFADGVTSIGTNAFANCANLKTLVLSKDVKKINENAFYNCDNLSAIYNYRPTPTNIYANTFSGVYKFDCILYVPDGSVEMYKSDGSNWKDFYFIETMGSASDEQTVIYIDKDDEIIDSEKIKLHLPEAPVIEGFTFLYWQPVAKDIQDGLTIQAIYEAVEPTSAPSIYSNPANPAQKLIRNGNVYILTEGKTYTVTGQEIK